MEGVAALAVALLVYHRGGSSWWIFVAAFLVPDVALLGYAVNARLGAAVYNALHTYAGPFLLGLLSLIVPVSFGLPVALAWTAHIGFRPRARVSG